MLADHPSAWNAAQAKGIGAGFLHTKSVFRNKMGEDGEERDAALWRDNSESESAGRTLTTNDTAVGSPYR